MVAFKSIASRDNPHYKHLRQLAGDTGRQRKEGLTIADGPHLVRACLEHGHPVRRLAVSESGLRNDEVARLLASADASLECWRLPDGMFKELSGTEAPVGILALIPFSAPQPWSAGEGTGRDVVMLDRVQDVGNLGSILRSAAAFGIGQVLLGEGCAAGWSPKVLRAAQGAHFLLALHEQVNLADALGRYRGHSLAMVLDGTPLMAGTLPPGPLAWVLGNEGQGISPAVTEHCSDRIRIPMTAGTESLNVAAAAAICFFASYSRML